MLAYIANHIMQIIVLTEFPSLDAINGTSSKLRYKQKNKLLREANSLR